MLSVKVPPIKGPMTEEMAKAMPKNAVKTGLLRRGTSGTMIMMPPTKIPAAPTPEIARPTMKADDVGAAPHKADPASKMINDIKKTHLVE